MTRVIRDRVLRDPNGEISDHLRNHIHLTNCIHLKNMHKHSPILANKSLMRDLVVLQRSRSLRDPSASPPSWHSPSAVDLLLKRRENESVIGNGRRSVDIECSRDLRRVSGSSPSIVGLSTGKLGRHMDRVAAVSEDSFNIGAHEDRRIKKEKSSGSQNLAPDYIHEKVEPTLAGDGNNKHHESLSGSSDLKDRNIKHKGKHGHKDHVKTLSEQLHEVSGGTDDAASSHANLQRRHIQGEKFVEETQDTIRPHSSALHRGKRRKFRGARRNRPAASQCASAHSGMSVASNSIAQAPPSHHDHLKEEDKDYVDYSVGKDLKNGCGVPWNWSRIHDRGKSFLDKAGRSFSCGLHESVLKKVGPGLQGTDVPELPVTSDNSSSSTGSDAEAVPLLMNAYGSQGSTDNAPWFHEYSGELGIFAQNLLKRDVDSDLASEARSGERRKANGARNGRHLSLTQKYMPKTFRDLVGQTLITRALSNVVMKRKVGLLYVFYGPHGTGKTSTARIFARALNCQTLEHPKPCGFCNSCIAHDTAKSQNIREIGPVSNFDFAGIMNLLESMVVSQMPSQYRVSIFDDCDTLSPDCWSSIAKVIDRAPRRVVFILVCSSLDVLPHIIISRCQKFYFPKLKDADIIYTLQWIASREDLEIDKDALKLIASKSDGSLRDAEMTLEQLSLLGQRISVPLVQEMVGLISDEKLVDLLDSALSADTVNTVKNLREIMESGVEPLSFMSQLATVITDILAGGFDFTREARRRKFFRRQALRKEDMEKLRQALKTLSEAEKQLRVSNDKLTWLTAALLQLAPDQQYMLPGSSADTSFHHSPMDLQNPARPERVGKSSADGKGLLTGVRMDNTQSENHRGFDRIGKKTGSNIEQRAHTATALVPRVAQSLSSDKNNSLTGQLPSRNLHSEIEEIWFEVLDKIHVNSIRQFLLQEGKLICVAFGAAPTVQLLFSSHLTKTKADKYKSHILQAFESVLGSPVTIEIRFESSKEARTGPIILPASKNRLSQIEINSGGNNGIVAAGYDNNSRKNPRDRDASSQLQFKSSGAGRSEIVELESSPRELRGDQNIQKETRKTAEGSLVGGVTDNHKSSFSDNSKLGDRNQSLSLVRGKVSLAHVIQQAEGYSQQNGWSKRKAISIAEKLEQENLRLEPQSRSLLCWKTSRTTRRKHSRLKVRTRRPQTLLKYVFCGKCLSNRFPR